MQYIDQHLPSKAALWEKLVSRPQGGESPGRVLSGDPGGDGGYAISMPKNGKRKGWGPFVSEQAKEKWHRTRGAQNQIYIYNQAQKRLSSEKKCDHGGREDRPKLLTHHGFVQESRRFFSTSFGLGNHIPSSIILPRAPPKTLVLLFASRFIVLYHITTHFDCLRRPATSIGSTT